MDLPITFSSLASDVALVQLLVSPQFGVTVPGSRLALRPLEVHRQLVRFLIRSPLRSVARHNLHIGRLTLIVS